MNKELYKNLLLYLYFGISCSIINMEVSLFEKTYFVKNENIGLYEHLYEPNYYIKRKNIKNAKRN